MRLSRRGRRESYVFVAFVGVWPFLRSMPDIVDTLRFFSRGVVPLQFLEPILCSSTINRLWRRVDVRTTRTITATTTAKIRTISILMLARLRTLCLWLPAGCFMCISVLHLKRLKLELWRDESSSPFLRAEVRRITADVMVYDDASGSLDLQVTFSSGERCIVPGWLSYKRYGREANKACYDKSCCSHINSHNQVRGHRTGSSHSGAEEYPREKTQTKGGIRMYHS